MSSPTLATRFRPYRAILAGFCGSTIATIILLFAHIFAQILAQGMGDQSLAYALAYNSLTAYVASNLYLASLVHFVLGVSFAMVYAKIVDSLPGRNSWKSGAVFSLALWLLSAVVFFPLVGAGFFALALDAGVLPVAGSLFLHLAYGVTLGLVYSPALANLRLNATAQHNDLAGYNGASVHAEKAAALGILGGSLVGIVLAGLGATVAGPSSLAVAGLPAGYTIMALVFFCIGMGMLVGFWTGAPDAEPGRHADLSTLRHPGYPSATQDSLPTD